MPYITNGNTIIKMGKAGSWKEMEMQTTIIIANECSYTLIEIRLNNKPVRYQLNYENEYMYSYETKKQAKQMFKEFVLAILEEEM